MSTAGLIGRFTNPKIQKTFWQRIPIATVVRTTLFVINYNLLFTVLPVTSNRVDNYIVALAINYNNSEVSVDSAPPPAI